MKQSLIVVLTLFAVCVAAHGCGGDDNSDEGSSDVDTDTGSETDSHTDSDTDSDTDTDTDADTDSDTDLDTDMKPDSDDFILLDGGLENGFSDLGRCLVPLARGNDSCEPCSFNDSIFYNSCDLCSFNDAIAYFMKNPGIESTRMAGSFTCKANNSRDVVAIWNDFCAQIPFMCRYYDQETGELIAVHTWSDYPEFCDHQSSDQWAGFVIREGCDESSQRLQRQQEQKISFSSCCSLESEWSEDNCYDFQIDNIP